MFIVVWNLIWSLNLWSQHKIFSIPFGSKLVNFGLMLNCFGPVRSRENIIGSVRGRGHKIYYFSVRSGSGQKITGQYGVGVPKTLPRRTLIPSVLLTYNPFLCPLSLTCFNKVNMICVHGSFRYFKNTVNILCMFIPEMIFLMSIFGYLCAMIFIKWFSYTAATSANAPSLITTLIDMFMFVSIEPKDQLYDGQV